MPQDKPPEIFHHYRILRRDDGSLWELGRGAMGVTYKAEDTNLHTTVALKVINALYFNDATARERFKREARAAASLRHRNVAAVYHLGNDEQTYYAMEFIDGETVESVVERDGPQPWRIALRYTLQVARALMAAHEKHLVHRDLKPANLMLVAEPGEDERVVKVIDFGLAKAFDEGAHAITETGQVWGSVAYSSPEQLQGIKLDTRSDIYSLGIVLWQLLTGKRPFEGSRDSLYFKHLQAPPPWEKLSSELPTNVRVLLARMLAKDRDDRPQTPAELRNMIDRCLEHGGVFMPAPSLVVNPSSDRRNDLPEPTVTMQASDGAATLVDPSSTLQTAKTAATHAGFPSRSPAEHSAAAIPAPVGVLPTKAVERQKAVPSPSPPPVAKKVPPTKNAERQKEVPPPADQPRTTPAHPFWKRPSLRLVFWIVLSMIGLVMPAASLAWSSNGALKDMSLFGFVGGIILSGVASLASVDQIKALEAQKKWPFHPYWKWLELWFGLIFLTLLAVLGLVAVVECVREMIGSVGGHPLKDLFFLVVGIFLSALGALGIRSQIKTFRTEREICRKSKNL